MEQIKKSKHIPPMHTFSQKDINSETTSVSDCSGLPEREITANNTGQNYSLQYNQELHKNEHKKPNSSEHGEQYDEKKAVMGKFRIGCDINFKQVTVNNQLCRQLNNIHLGAEVQSESTSNQLNLENIKTKCSVNSITQPTVISNANHSTTTSNESKGVPTDRGRYYTNSSTIGKNELSSTETKYVHVLFEETSKCQCALNIACKTQNTPLPSPACVTCYNHSHCESDNRTDPHTFTRKLTNALSSEPLINLPVSSYCSNFTSMSPCKRQLSLLKSQSLDIVEDPQPIIENDELLFLHIPEIDEGEQQQRLDNTKHDGNITAQNGQKNSSSHKTGWDFIKTQSLDSRPIYPNVPYSPYSSPRSNRRRPPLRESRRISIERSGSFLQLNQYKLLDQIGQGSYGLVKLAYSEEDSTHYAMKILSKRRLLRQAGLMKRGPKKGTSPLDRVYREIAVLKKLDHPNVVKLVEVLDDPIEDSLYMVFELVKQGEILSIPTNTPLTEERAWSVFRDTLLGLEYLHYQKIIHADIKPGNLLQTECGRVKIADLGVCNEFIGEDSTMTNGSTGGTPAFRAPETLNVGQNIYCGKAADIWALGATLFALVYGNVPFVATSIPVLYEMIKTNDVCFPDNVQMSPALTDCIRKMLVKDPGSRITLSELKIHSWVTASESFPLPNEEENCRLVQVNDEDINSVVRSIPKLDTLILIKTMLKKHSFGNPFSRGISGRAPLRGGSRLERFVRAGRSNSAPGAYPITERQLSGECVLPALSENASLSFASEE